MGLKTMYRDIFKEEAIDKIMIEELDLAIELAVAEKDDALLGSLHTVRAYFSIPGTYLEGSYDGE
tara:strand:+ start:338 stop:532 length:195 start_codon:yes stop_codon:yes gene_type:complete